jgi:hypothetical protein
MNHSLDPARLKLIRAEEHIHALEDEVRKYLDTQPYEFLERDQDDERIVVRVTASPPLHLSTIVGDCVYNLGASLDLTFWALTSRTGPSDPDRDRVFFPIFSNEAKFRAAHSGLTKRISTPAVGILEQVQPFHTRNLALTMLRALSKQDRHGSLVLTVSGIATGNEPTAFVAFAEPTVPIASVDIVLSKILRHIKTDVVPKFESLCA